MYEQDWILLSEAHSRLCRRLGVETDVAARALWSALADGAIVAQGYRKVGEGQRTGEDVNRFKFKDTTDLDDIQEAIRQSEVIAWKDQYRVQWEVQVRWSEVIKALVPNDGGPAQRQRHQGRFRLELSLVSEKVTLDRKLLKLSPRSFSLLRILASAACVSEAPVEKEALRRELFHGRKDDNPVAIAMGHLRREIRSSGIDDVVVKDLIENVRSRGYRLGLNASEINMEQRD